MCYIVATKGKQIGKPKGRKERKMKKFTCPWDESGNLIPGVKVREYAMFIKNNGVSGNFSIDGTLYNLHSLLIAPPDDVDLDAVVIAIDGGYYGNFGVKTK